MGVCSSISRTVLNFGETSTASSESLSVRLMDDSVLPKSEQQQLPQPTQDLGCPYAPPANLGRVLRRPMRDVREDYTFGRELGRGQFGVTFLVIHKGTQQRFACKSIATWKLVRREDLDDVRREVHVMHHLTGHRNIVELKEVYEDNHSINLIMELCEGGELFDRIIAKRHYTERAAASLFKQIVTVVHNCHTMGVMHRDLKPENFLFSSTQEDSPLKATDFGLSVFFKQGDTFHNLVGSAYYIAPEVLHRQYGVEADIWSVGVILYILLCGKPPFWAKKERVIFEEIRRGLINFSSDPWPSISSCAKDLICKMLTADPKKRLSAVEVLNHPWMREDSDAPDGPPLGITVITRMKQFMAMNKLKRVALKIVAENLSEEEIMGLKEMFKSMDIDSSGTITYDELKSGLSNLGSKMSESEMRQLMESTDVDGNGTIDYVEFISATMHMNRLETEDRLYQAFEYFDKDKSGFITKEELEEALTKYNLDDLTTIQEILAEVDTNNDGKINYEEFVVMMKKGSEVVENRICSDFIPVHQKDHARTADKQRPQTNPECATVPSPNVGQVLGHPIRDIREDYTFEKELGRGQFGVTYLVIHKVTEQQFACKSIMTCKLIRHDDIDDVRREVQIMHHLTGHRNIVELKAVYEDNTHVYLVMELCEGGELFDRIISKGHYTERGAASLFREIVTSVYNCHTMGVMHRDLKPENFLFSSTHEEAPLKATDFGLSVFIKEGDVLHTLVGSAYYIAPEVLRRRYGVEADIWSAGVILYILLCGIPPFWASSDRGIFKEILNGRVSFSSDPWPSISDSAKDLVKKMLAYDPMKRPSALEVLNHPWMIDDSNAPDELLDITIVTRMKQFMAMNKLKKVALKVVAENLNEEEIMGLREMFKSMDPNHSGTITYLELKSGLSKLGTKMPENELKQIIESIDIDENGMIDYMEFISATMHMNRLEKKDHLYHAFEYFDKDKSGYITKDELVDALKKHNTDDLKTVEDVLAEVDSNNDGNINYEEFVAMMTKDCSLEGSSSQ